MMNRFLALLILPGLWLAACGGTPQPSATATPTPAGSWEAVIEGVVYDGHAEPYKPVTGAVIRYDVLSSHFGGLQTGRPNQTVSDELGEFTLPVMVHDTDSIRLLVEARGYLSYEERLVGIDLVGGKRFDIGLRLLPNGTATPP